MIAPTGAFLHGFADQTARRAVLFFLIKTPSVIQENPASSRDPNVS
jgi:hypothetical protein